MLCDAGPLIALVDTRQEHHSRCEEVFAARPSHLTTTWACLAEAMHVVGSRGRTRLQLHLWQMWSRGHLHLHNHTLREISRMAELMAHYQNVPMDLADASLIAAAEVTGEDTVFTLDSDFRIYRLRDGSALKLLPE